MTATIDETNTSLTTCVTPPLHRQGWARRRWAVAAFIATGWFIHDAALHAALVVLGVNGLVGLELGLPDLGALGIYPDRPLQAGALAFAVLAAAILVLVVRRYLNGVVPDANRGPETSR